MHRPEIEPPDIDEKGANGQRSDRRLFMQLLVFGGCRETDSLIAGLEGLNMSGVLYEDVNDPLGVAMLSMSEDPRYFVDAIRGLIAHGPFSPLEPKPRYTMFGRTYALGHEQDLDETLRRRPRRHVLNPQWPWAIWYPLRRSGAFAQLPPGDQRQILNEHGAIGMAFGRAGYAHDIRLACFGLDRSDNDFVIGLTGPDLTPLSKVVETMRKTRQTSQFIENLGPFFVGRAVWQSAELA